MLEVQHGTRDAVKAKGLGDSQLDEGQIPRVVKARSHADICTTTIRVGYEFFGLKAYFDEDWQVLWMPPLFGRSGWELYNLKEDPAELNDLSSEYPQKIENMVALWGQHRDDNRVLDISLDLANKVK